MKRVFIIHGYTGYPDKNWFPWLKSELEKSGVHVVVPAMPNSENPKLSEWLPFLQSLVGKVDENTFFVGHSLGCITILRYLETLEKGVRIGGVILVAGFASPIHLHQLDNFFETALQYEKIKSSVGKLVAINSDNDPHVPYDHAEELRDKFGAELIKFPNGQHLNEKAGFKQFPLVLEHLNQIMA